MMRCKRQAHSPHADDIVAELVVATRSGKILQAKRSTYLVGAKRWTVRLEVLRDDGELRRCVAAFDDLLRCPRAVLVRANESQVWGDALQHGQAKLRIGLFEEPLDETVADILRREVCESWSPLAQELGLGSHH